MYQLMKWFLASERSVPMSLSRSRMSAAKELMWANSASRGMWKRMQSDSCQRVDDLSCESSNGDSCGVEVWDGVASPWHGGELNAEAEKEDSSRAGAVEVDILLYSLYSSIVVSFVVSFAVSLVSVFDW